MRKLLFLFLLFPSIVFAQTTKTAYIFPGCANNGNGTTSSCAGSPGGAGAYNSCANAISAEKTNLVTADRFLDLIGVGSATADTSACDFLDADWTTDATRYVRLRTLTSDRHDGKWNTSEYRIASAAYYGVLQVTIPYFDGDGLQLENTTTGAGAGTGGNGFRFFRASGAGRIRLTNTVFRYTGDYTNQKAAAIAYESDSTGGVTTIFANNIAYDWNYGVFGRSRAGDVLAIYNNTFADGVINEFWFERYSGTIRFFNNLMQGAGTNVEWNGSSGATFASGTNITEDTTSPDGASYRSIARTFANEAGNDFHLTAAETTGTDLTADGTYPVTTDIDNQTISVPTNIGADYYYTAPTPTPTPSVTTRKGQKCAAIKGQCLQ